MPAVADVVARVVRMGVAFADAPAAAAWDGRVHVFARGSDGALYLKSGDGRSWEPWHSMGGVVVSSRVGDRDFASACGNDFGGELSEPARSADHQRSLAAEAIASDSCTDVLG